MIKQEFLRLKETLIFDELMALKETRKHAIQKSPIFDRKLKLTQDELGIVFGQYWHLLTYFPDFLAHLITSLPRLEDKSKIARVLSEECGNGDLKEAHEGAYFEAMKMLGISEESVRKSVPLPATQKMMNAYYACADEPMKGLGFFISTEFADLWIVSNLGRLMLNALPKRQKVKWIDLHVTQEPGHVDDATACLNWINDSKKLGSIVMNAHECSNLWDSFFIGLHNEIQSRRNNLKKLA